MDRVTRVLTPLFFVFYAKGVGVDGDIYCGAGTYLVPGTEKNIGHCEQCPSDTFIEDKHHQKTHCEWCMIYDEFDPYRELVSNCTNTRNTVVKCRDPRYYYNTTHPASCHVCTDCEQFGLFTAMPCSDYSNTVCCTSKNMMVKNSKCIEYIKCGYGERLKPDVQGLTGKSGVCLPCPEGKTNVASDHTRLECQDHCYSVRGNESSHVIERFFKCEAGEELLGIGCLKESAVICQRHTVTESPSQEDSDSTEEPERDMGGSKSMSNSLIVGIVVGVVVPVAAFILVCLLVCYCRESQVKFWYQRIRQRETVDRSTETCTVPCETVTEV